MAKTKTFKRGYSSVQRKKKKVGEVKTNGANSAESLPKGSRH
jgi:hypothetical protein